MLTQFSHERSQALLRQRNLFALTSAGLGLALVVAASLAATRDREVVLVPTLSKALTISKSGINADYLELVTRDAALMLLNRSPESLDYWMAQILELAAPAHHGELKAELVRIVEEQRGSDVAQAFVIKELNVDPERQTSEVSGTLKTFVGAQVIASDERKFRFTWTYQGLRLGLAGFAQLATDETPQENTDAQ
ncbi:MAG: type IV conjugative transfer system protein TraE [Sphingomonadaceae bacterium]|jgi:conjugal transfer pilus assembly protein TraE|nr:type IV conjugative transfer system protein TraE [Sphingomonadaceae bacterium]